jgi:hypothetical protein
MAFPTRSSKDLNTRAWGSVVLGVLSVACVPAGIAVTHYRDIDLVRAAWAVLPGLALGIVSIALARGARRRTERTIGRVGGRGITRVGRLLGLLGIYLALAGALAVGVYQLLNKLSA